MSLQILHYSNVAKSFGWEMLACSKYDYNYLAICVKFLIPYVLEVTIVYTSFAVFSVCVSVCACVVWVRVRVCVCGRV